MLLQEIYEICNEISPFEIQETWDNSGLQIGSSSDVIKDIRVALEVDDFVIDNAEEGSLIITHHPLIFGSLKRIDFSSYPSNMIQKMIKKDISLISMHTNFDKTHLNHFLAKEVLGFSITSSDGFVIYCDVDISFEELEKKVVKSLNLNYTKKILGKKHIKKIALCSGSGASLLPTIKADCFLTGDIKYHDAMLAKSLGIAMIDIGHYESECFFGEILKKELKNFGIQAIISNSMNPFDYR